MNKTILFIPLFILALTFVSATTLELKSDTSNEYFDGANWQPAVAVTDSSAWSSITIPATWIWNTESTNVTSTEQFRKTFDLPCNNVDTAVLAITADNQYNVTLNGQAIAADNSDGNWMDVETYNIPSNLFTSGSNVLAIYAENYEGGSATNPAGLIYTLNISYHCSTGTGSHNTVTPASVTGSVMYANDSAVVGANVDVLCNNVTESTTTNELGDYYVLFTSDICDFGSSVKVTAEKDGVSGTNNGETCANATQCEIPVALVNVTIPEFGIIGAAIVLLAGLGIIVYRRK